MKLDQAHNGNKTLLKVYKYKISILIKIIKEGLSKMKAKKFAVILPIEFLAVFMLFSLVRTEKSCKAEQQVITSQNFYKKINGKASNCRLYHSILVQYIVNIYIMLRYNTNQFQLHLLYNANQFHRASFTTMRN